MSGDGSSAGQAAQEELAEYAGRHVVWKSARLVALAEAELAAGRQLAPDVVAVIRRSAMESYQRPAFTSLVKRLTEPVLNPGEEWSDQVIGELPGLAAPWRDLVAHASTAVTAKPGDKWDRTGRALLAMLDADEVRERVLTWLTPVGRPRTTPYEEVKYLPGLNHGYDPFNADALRGLAWLLSLLPAHPRTTRALGALAETSLRKVPGVGPRNPKVANACVIALSRIDGESALAELARLSAKVTFKGTLKILDAVLDARAESLGLSREEIEELAVPAYGLTEVGGAVRQLGDATARLRIEGSRTAVEWRTAVGKVVKSPPAGVRRDHPEELKELKAAVKDIDKMLTAQVERLDRQFLARRDWGYAAWRERYLDHPLVGTLARRLLWTVDGRSCGFADGELRTLADEPVTEGGTVELWHPIGRPVEEVVAWRDWLERHAITQPFKQAHREVYLLTDAERATGTYSNRFAAHILRQYQFHSLAAVRGWSDQLRLAVDDSVPPATRELRRWGLRAEFWVGGDGDGEHGPDVTDSGSYERLRTDQVRFYPLDAPINYAHSYGGEYRMWPAAGTAVVDPLPLSQIPELVLSEVLRDVDLFVGVSSVGNDPTWQDGGPEGRFQGYWTSYGFGELGQSALTRRDLLTRLLPRLAIGGRCSIDGRFLLVRGTRHTYKIHLGSGNILITPGDRYLCIVPTSRRGAGAETGYLPFEGDRTLAVILSKAMMLAHDTAITDPTILSQL